MLFDVRQFENNNDKVMLRKGRCPWCTQKLSPVFVGDDHVADACNGCGDTFADSGRPFDVTDGERIHDIAHGESDENND